LFYKRSMSLARGAYQPTQQRSPVIEEASGGAGAPIYMELRRFTFRQQQICYFFPVDHQRGSWGGRSAASQGLRRSRGEPRTSSVHGDFTFSSINWRRVVNLRISICTMIIGGIAAGNVLADVTASPTVASSVSDKETTSRVHRGSVFLMRRRAAALNRRSNQAHAPLPT